MPMTNPLRIVIAQLNLQVGDIAGNLKKHIEASLTARDKLSADIIVFPELSLTGYPPEDLLLRKSFIDESNDALKHFINQVQGIHCLVGHPDFSENHLYNSCSLIYNGDVLATYAKQRLPNYGVFDEARYFTPGKKPTLITIKNIPIGIVICEDLWSTHATHEVAQLGARVILSPNASPFETNKHERRMKVLHKRARENHVAIFYVNVVGGQDELIFDGGSSVTNENGELTHLAPFFKEALLPVNLEVSQKKINLSPEVPALLPTIKRVYEALKLGVKDYVEKNHFPGVLIGLSGGIDSALTLAIAVDALGPDRVIGVLMPSRYTSTISLEDAYLIAKNLGVQTKEISIEPCYQSILNSLSPAFQHQKPDITEENIQSRARALILMALSNKFGHLVLTTGNRSELAVGYCTLYGDMAGGFAVLKDVYKTMVYELAHFRNQLSSVIPTRTIERPPTAELAFDQKDEDSLPPYATLDKILALYLDHKKSINDIIAAGFNEDVVKKVINLIRRNEYKRRQAAIGPRINLYSFGKDWRYPVTSGFKK